MASRVASGLRRSAGATLGLLRSYTHVRNYNSQLSALIPVGSQCSKPTRRGDYVPNASPYQLWNRSFASDYGDKFEAVAPPAFTGNLKKALAGLRRINLDGLRWRVFDAKGQVLGRLASQIAVVLQGKDKPTYAPHVENGDMCIVLNAKDISVTGRKMTDKIYYWHTGYIGHLKERRLKDQMERDPTEVVRKAVLRMLPRNRLRDDRDRKLRIFSGSEHPFHDRSLEPFVMPPRQVREMRPRARRALIRAQKREQANRAAAESAKDEDGKTAKGGVTA